jgi:hypothetical protein
VLAAPPAQIVLARSIAGVTLGLRRPQLTTRLGKGVVTKSGTGSFGPYTIVNYPKQHVSVTLVQGVATTVSTRWKTYRMANGVGVGTPKARLLAAFGKQIACGNYEVCTIGKALPGVVVTTFQLQAGRVFEVDVSNTLN